MKKVLLITLLCFGFITANAQRYKPGLKAGLNNTNLIIRQDTTDLKKSILNEIKPKAFIPL